MAAENDITSIGAHQATGGLPMPGIVEDLRSQLVIDEAGYLLPAEFSRDEEELVWGPGGRPAEPRSLRTILQEMPRGATAWVGGLLRQTLRGLDESAVVTQPPLHDADSDGPISPAATSDIVSPISDSAPKTSEEWEAERQWWEEATVATQGTRARFFLLIKAEKPELSRDAAWELATKQAYDDLRERCPDGSIVASSHPWDREYMRQMGKVMADRRTALDAQAETHALAVERAAARLADVRSRRDEYLMAATDHDESVLAVFDHWEQSTLQTSTEHDAWYAARLELNQQEFCGSAVFDRAIAATIRRLKPDADHATLIIHEHNLDRDEEWERSPYRADFERVRNGLMRVLRAIRGGNGSDMERPPLAEFYWDQVASISGILLTQSYDDTTAYRLAQDAAVHRALGQYDRVLVASLPGADKYLR